MDNIKTLYLDFDGVIVNTIKSIVGLYNEDFQYYKDFKPVEWSSIESWWFKECSLASEDTINGYFNTPRFFENIEFMPWAESVINDLKQYYKIKVVSMGCQPNLYGKELWLNSHFSDIEFVGIEFDGHDNDKSQIDMSDGLLLDDRYDNLATSNAYMKVCFGDEYDWNWKWDGERVWNWQELRKLLIPNA